MTEEAAPPLELPTGPEPVKAEPFWQQLPQLFLVPLLIVLVCVAVYAIFGVLGGDSLDAKSLVHEIGTTHDAWRRDQCAYELAIALGRPGSQPPAGLAEEIGRMLDREDLPPNTRSYLALALGQIGPSARPQLQAALLSKFGEVQAHAALALGMVGTPEDAPALATLSANEKPILKKVALLAMARIAAKDAALKDQAREIGRRQLSDGDFQVSWNAALILSQFDDESCRWVLRRMTDRAYVESQLSRAQAQVTDAEVPFLPLETEVGKGVDVPADVSRRLLVDVCRALGRVGGKEDLPRLEALAGASSLAPHQGWGVIEISVMVLGAASVVLLIAGLGLKKGNVTTTAIGVFIVALCLAPLGEYSQPHDPVAAAAKAAAAQIQKRVGPS